MYEYIRPGMLCVKSVTENPLKINLIAAMAKILLLLIQSNRA